jgi:hypothetical protein
MSDFEDSSFEQFEKEIGISVLDQDATQMHELFLSLVKAGFKERQALVLVALIVNESSQEDVVFSLDPDALEDDEDEE